VETDDLPDDLKRRASARLGQVARGKYRLTRVIGVGGMAVVYRAAHRNGTDFAVKMLHPELSMSAEVRTRFLREGYLANKVKHPGAVWAIDDDVAEDGTAFIVMELLEGDSVEGLAEASGGRLSLEAITAIMLQALEVLEAAHEQQIVHRDLKPGNLFVTTAGAVKVLDFGIARLRDLTATQVTRSGISMGTPAFMAPEQALGKSKEADGRTDLWALGATMFTLASGEIVHPAENAQQVMIGTATRPARSLRSVTAPPSPAAGDIIDVVDRALAFRAEDRWESAGAMKAALLAAATRAFSAVPGAEVLRSLVAEHQSPVRTQSRAVTGSPVFGEVSATEIGSAETLPEAAASVLRVGTTTADPVSSDRDGRKATVQLRRSRPRLWPALTVFGLSVAGIALKVHGAPSTTENPRPASSVPQTPGTVASAPPVPSTPPAPPPPTPQDVVPPAVAATSAVPRPPLAPRPAAVKVPSVAPSARAKVDCTPAWYRDKSTWMPRVTARSAMRTRDQTARCRKERPMPSSTGATRRAPARRGFMMPPWRRATRIRAARTPTRVSSRWRRRLASPAAWSWMARTST